VPVALLCAAAPVRGQCDPQEVAHLFASDGAAFDAFGWSVAISGDTAVVGAWDDDTPEETDVGSAYVFVRSGGVWTQQAHLFASDGAAFDYFGVSVAIFGDTAVVGAWDDDTPGGPDAGSAYVFVRSGGVWTEQAHLFASDGAADDHFGGVYIAISGDTAVVGANSDDTPGGWDAGSAYVFVRSGGVWTEQAHLFASDGATDDLFGQSVAISGDTVVVGAIWDDTPGGTDAGSAFVFVRSGGVWTEQAHLFAADGAAGDFFGRSIALSGDTAIVGTNKDDTPGGIDAGSAYVFNRSGGVWTQQAHLFASDGAAGDLFARSVAISGEMVVVGASDDDTEGGTDAGSAYFFVRNDGDWTEQAHLFASDGAAGDFFGFGVAISGDTAVVGALFDDTPRGTDAGSAYVFDLRCGGCGDRARLTAKCKNGGATVLGTLKKATPDTPVTFTLDGREPVERTTNNKGKAKAKYTRQAPGSHTVRACALEADC